MNYCGDTSDFIPKKKNKAAFAVPGPLKLGFGDPSIKKDSIMPSRKLSRKQDFKKAFKKARFQESFQKSFQKPTLKKGKSEKSKIIATMKRALS